MILDIKIECDTKKEALQHLMSIAHNFLNIEEKVLEEENLSFEDSNCYGTHQVNITAEEPFKTMFRTVPGDADYKGDFTTIKKFLAETLADIEQFEKTF